MSAGVARKTALVTGVAGFLGSHLVDRLLAEDFEVIGIDNLMTGDLNNLEQAGRNPHFHFRKGDVRDPLHIDNADYIFNFACPASPHHYQSDPHATLTTNVLGALRLVEMARERRCTIIHASTSEVYGDPAIHPQPETYWGNVNPIGTRACYNEGKRCAETLLSDARRLWGIDARIARIFNTYGPRMAFNDGRVVSNFIVQALRGKALTIFGDGHQTRSFCYVSDLIDGILGMLRPDRLETPINLGNPEEVTIYDLAWEIAHIVGGDATIVHGPAPADDPRKRRPDISLARELIGFSPRIALRGGLRETVADFRSRLGDYLAGPNNAPPMERIYQAAGIKIRVGKSTQRSS